MKQNDTQKFENFINAFGATRMLLQRAHENGFLLEGLVLYASVVDGFCRIGLILKEQLKNKSSYINFSYIYQDDGDFYSERAIYKQAYKNKIIDKDLYNELGKLYDIRNKFIHRFFISEIEYSHLEIVCKRYEAVYQELYNIVYTLEAEQIKKSTGMTIAGTFSQKDKENSKRDILKKIKTKSERNLAKTLDCVSVEEVIEFGEKKGLFKECNRCKHPKVEHLNVDNLTKEKDGNIDFVKFLVSCKHRSCKCSEYE